MRRECRECFPLHRELAIRTCITARAWRACRDTCRDLKLAVSFEVGGGENIPGIPGACANRNFGYLVRGTCGLNSFTYHVGQLRNEMPSSIKQDTSHDRPMFIMEIPHLENRLYIETGSWWSLYWRPDIVVSFMRKKTTVYVYIYIYICRKL